MTLGVFAGSAAWWVVLVTRRRGAPLAADAARAAGVNIVSGLVIGAFAMVAIAIALRADGRAL